MDLSVIICTHNPRPDLLEEVLTHLEQQSADRGRHPWDIVLVDNNSSPPVLIAPSLALPLRVVHEPVPGLTAARRRGVLESQAPLLLFVDDDNLLDPDYVENALDLAMRYPQVGVFSALVRPRFEKVPRAGDRDFLRFLALTDFAKDEVSFDAVSPCMPVGAGMMVRRSVMEAYEREVQAHPWRAGMGRTGTVCLLGGDDSDIGYVSLAMGLACGRFTGLRLTHVISARRVAPDYLRRLAREVTCSHEVLRIRHGGIEPSRALAWRYRFKRFVIWFFRWQPMRKVRYEEYGGRLAALHRMAGDSGRRASQGGRVS